MEENVNLQIDSGCRRSVHRRSGDLIVVGSGKGGVGKTNFALNAGIHLARRGARVTLVDADFGLANVDVLLNLTPARDLVTVLRDPRSIESALVPGPDGLRVLCGASGLRCNFAPWEIDPRDCLQLAQVLTAISDCVIVDCGAGVSSLIRCFSLASDMLILVTTPEPTAVVDAYATLKILHTRGFRGLVGLVVNMAHTRRDANVTMQRLRTAAREFLGLSVTDLGCIPFDRHVPLAVQQRCPLAVRYPLCSASIGIDESSRRFARKGAGGVQTSTLLEKVAKLFL